ncbi:MAG: serine--tRNA ligase [Candidatus Micrarchaeia archaeon]
MLTTKYVRDNLEAIRDSLARRHSDYPLDRLLELDKEWRSLKTATQALQAERNKLSMEISRLKKEGKNEEADAIIKRLSETKKRIEDGEAKIAEEEAEIDKILWNMPNVLHESVPYGKDDSENKEVKRWGSIEKKGGESHADILERMGLIELEQAAKVAGARFFYLKGDIALLEQSLIRFAIDELIKKGYMLIAPPLMMKKEYYKGVTAFGDFEEMLYKAADPKEAEADKDIEHVNDELFMIATSEHPMAAMYAGKVLSANELPKKFVGVSPCFRREAGAHGKDTKGIFRVHHFYKVEQFIFSKQEDSWKLHEELLANAESLFQKMKIPYRVVNVCTGDIGTVAAKKYDIEAYMPAQGAYREEVSCSNCTDWQSLRLDIKYDEGNERKYVHTLNSTAIATNRTIVAIVENYANGDGTITVPEVLVPYMGKDKIGKPNSN